MATRPNRVRAAVFGLLAAIGIGGLFAIFVGILDLDVGLLALAAIGGWGIGVATRAGAWPNAMALPARSVRRLAVGFGVTAWLGGYFGGYLLSLLLRPDSSLTFGQRLAQSPFLDWLSPQFGVRQVIEVLLLCGIAWYSSGARSGSASGSSE